MIFRLTTVLIVLYSSFLWGARNNAFMDWDILSNARGGNGRKEDK